MLVTERKRVVVDEQGTLCKMDILRSIRRKDVEGTVMAESSDQQQKAAITNDSNNLTRYLQTALLLAITLIVVFLILRLYTSAATGTVTNIQINSVMEAAKEEFSLQQLRQSLTLNQSQWHGLQETLLNLMKCQKNGGVLSCHVSLDQKITNI